VARYWFRKKHPFRDYTGGEHGNGIYRIDDRARISLAGDWGTGTDEAHMVADRMREFRPDITIHLGDVYYVGDETEIDENFLGKKTSPYEPVEWPMGAKGSFALSGNHEMYARGMGYFSSILPRMGLSAQPAAGGAPEAAMAGQWASFFCLENNFWKIIGIDTGYNSTGFDWGKLPVLKHIKSLLRNEHFKPNCRIPEPVLAWLDAVVKPNDDGRGLILLSHHGSHSAFSDWYKIPARQLAGAIRRPAMWFWGHEHKLAIYDRFGPPDGIRTFGRCIGHGGMPVEKAPHPQADCPVIGWDNRRYDNGEKIDVGYNGHANLTFDGASLRIEYVDLLGKALFNETWSADVKSGTLSGPQLQKTSDDPHVHIRAATG
jgi:Calcineurin-like phosphoesterase